MSIIGFDKISFWLSLSDNGTAIEKSIYRSPLKLRTCKRYGKLDEHRFREGKRFPVKEQQVGVNLHPMHPWCRSTTMPDMTAEQLRKVPRAARDPKTGKSITVPGDMTYQQWYEKFVEGAKPLAKSGESGILKSIGAERIPVTQEAIDSVPSARVSWWDDEMAERVKEAHKNLLESVKDKKVGVEEARILSTDGIVVKEYPEKNAAHEDSRVKVPDQPFDYILLHNHPDCSPFSPADLEKFFLRKNLRGLTAIGHNGRVFGVIKGPEFNDAAMMDRYISQSLRIEKAIHAGDLDGYLGLLNSILEEAEKNGAEFIR